MTQDSLDMVSVTPLASCNYDPALVSGLSKLVDHSPRRRASIHPRGLVPLLGIALDG